MTFKRGTKELSFSGLIVSNLSVDILAGTNFHVENDVYSRMAKGTIHIGDTITVQSFSPHLLTLHTTPSLLPPPIVLSGYPRLLRFFLAMKWCFRLRLI